MRNRKIAAPGQPGRSGRSAARRGGTFCLAAGLLLLAWAAAIRTEAFAWQESHRSAFESVPVTIGPAPEPEPPRGEALARLRIERLGIDVVVAEGSDRAILTRGPGHLAGSALPGRADNCVIAGHRDGAFGKLRSVRRGDVVELTGMRGPVRYRVTEIDVVNRTDTRPLAPSDAPTLTLVTCYPFNFVGPAPRRFIVRGELLGPGDAGTAQGEDWRQPLQSRSASD